MESKIVIVIFIVGVTVIFSEAIDSPGNQFNRLRNPRNNLLQDARFQERETNLLSSRISNNVKDNSNSEILGGYRPLFPPFFPLKTPLASKKPYFDKEYYTRGTDELDLINNENQERENLARALYQPTVPLQQRIPISVNNNVKFYQQTSSSTNVRSYIPSSGNIRYLPTVNGWPNVKINDDHEVTFITYS